MFGVRPISAAWLACLLPAAASALAPARYVPAPGGKPYFMVTGEFNSGLTVNTDESGPIPSLDGATHTFKSQWTSTTGEAGVLVGYGLGSVLFLPSLDASLYVPVTFRTFGLSSDTADGSAAYGKETLHASLADGGSGKGIGDVTAQALALLYGSADNGTWISLGLKVALATGTSAAQRFVSILHGDPVDPASGDGVTRLVPVLSGIKTIAGQRLYVNLEYRQPMGTQSWSFHSPSTYSSPGYLYDDANLDFTEEVKPAGVALGTVGLETSLSVLGIVPSLELNVRQYQAETWNENGASGLATWPRAGAGRAYPTYNPEFLRAAAWVVGGMPLKSDTESEVALLGASRSGNDLYKLGLSYRATSYGSEYGVRFSFTTLFVEKPEGPHRATPGKAEAEEVQVSPVLEAPAAPTGRLLTVVTFPYYQQGATAEDADVMARGMRDVVRKLPGYELFPEKDMAQLASQPCGEPVCGAQFGRALKVPAVFVGNLAKTAEGFAMSITLVNVADATAAGMETIGGPDLGALKAQLPAVFTKLTAPAPAAAPAPAR